MCGQRSPSAGGGQGTGTSCPGPAACRLPWAQVWRGQAQRPASLTGSPWRSEPGSQAGSGHLPRSPLRCWRPGAAAGSGLLCCTPAQRWGGRPRGRQMWGSPPPPRYHHCAFKARGSTQLRASREPWHPASLGLLIKDTQSHAQTHRGAPPPGDTVRERCRDAAEPCQQSPSLQLQAHQPPTEAWIFPG